MGGANSRCLNSSSCLRYVSVCMWHRLTYTCKPNSVSIPLKFASVHVFRIYRWINPHSTNTMLHPAEKKVAFVQPRNTLTTRYHHPPDDFFFFSVLSLLIALRTTHFCIRKRKIAAEKSREERQRQSVWVKKTHGFSVYIE